MNDFDRHVNAIGRRRALTFFIPRLIAIAAVAALVWKCTQ